MLTDWIEEIQIPVARISVATADTLLQGTERTIRDLARDAEAGQGEAVAVAGSDVELDVNVARRTRTERNVVAMLEGADRSANSGYVIICAHFDHEGITDGEVFNGADDDGSGTVALMEIAEAYALAAREGRRPDDRSCSPL